MFRVRTVFLNIFCIEKFLCYTESMKNAKKKAYIRETSIYIYLVGNRRLLGCALLWGVPFAISCVLGRRLVHEGTVFGPGGSAAAYIGSFLLFLLETAVLSVPAAALAGVVLRGGRARNGSSEECGGQEKCGLSETQEESRATVEAAAARGERARLHPVWQVWFFYGILIFLCWLPVFLAYYPSVFAYDAEGQLYQVIAKDYSTHHPLLHTLFLGAFFRLGGALGSYQTGMAVHSVVQMALMAVVFGRALSFLYQRRISGRVRALLFLFFAFFPANSVLALSTTKDVLFAAFVLLYTLCFYRMVCDRDGAADIKEGAAFAFWAVLMLLFRNNAVYAFAVSIPVVCSGLGKEKRRAGSGASVRKVYLRMSLSALVLFAVCAFSLKAATHAQSGSPREMLSVPLQQMARARVKAEEEIVPVMRMELDEYVSSQWVFAAYNPHLADPIKSRAVIHDNPVGLIRTWIRLGLDYPAIYIDAFLDNSLGMWYLWDVSHAQVYGIGTKSGFGYLSTDNRTMPAGCEIVERSYLPGLRAFMERIVSDNVYQKLPFVRLLFSPALYWWLLWFYLVAALYYQRGREALPAVFLTAYYLTLLLSPTVIVRYLYPLIVTVPVILPCVLTKRIETDY